jgi:hypothetical protein
MARLPLAEWQQHQVDAYLRQIVPTMLHPKQRATFISIKAYYEMDKKLSDKQIACLRRYMDITHSVSSKMNSGKHYDVNDVFNVRANPIR